MSDDLVLDAGSFTSAERLEIQAKWDYPFTGILDHLRQSMGSGTQITTAVVSRDGERAWPDQIIAHMLWVQARRADPDATLATFEALSQAQLNNAFLDGLLGKGWRTARSKRSSRGSSSAGSSEG